MYYALRRGVKCKNVALTISRRAICRGQWDPVSSLGQPMAVCGQSTSAYGQSRSQSSFSQLQYPLRTNPPVITQHTASSKTASSDMKNDKDDGDKDSHKDSDKLQPPETGER